MEFVLISSGGFRMGSSSDDADEKPVHEVIITKDFYMGKFEVTQDQWRRVMGATQRQQNAYRREFLGEGANYPIYDVTWNSAQEFIRRLNRSRDGNTYRLPTEAEWEYACGAGKPRMIDGPALDQIAWYGRNSGNLTHPVGTKQPNAFGLYDMLGNVWEWCQDWYDENYYQNSPGKDPLGPATGKSRVYRGGDYWGQSPRCENRDWGGLTGGNTGLNGLRVVADR
jgi:formylglycine-generating enzyme required for sulfatase activity